ncbi:MAG: hypothetical protein ACPL4H_09200 [Anaerolineales bacterium]
MNKVETPHVRRSPLRYLTYFWNCATVVLLLMTFCVLGVALIIFLNPHSGLNPFPPPPLPEVIQLPSPTPTAIQILPPTWTPIPTRTPRPTKTSTITPTFTDTLPPTATETATATLLAEQEVRYKLSIGSPKALAVTKFHPEAGCNWLGIAGQVFDEKGAPVENGSIILIVSGWLGENYIEKSGIVGMAPQYGPAGYEIVLGDGPIATQGKLSLQLFDTQGKPLTNPIMFDTSDACDQNLIIINLSRIAGR